MFERNGPLRIAATVVISTALVAGCSSLSAPGGVGERRRSPWGRRVRPAPSIRRPPGTARGSCSENVFQTLLSFPAGAYRARARRRRELRVHRPQEPCLPLQAARGPEVLQREPLDAKAVKHSIDRIGKINVKAGPRRLLGSLDRVEAPNRPRRSIFHLKKPDATFPFVLATPAVSIVDPEELSGGRAAQGRQGRRLRAVHRWSPTSEGKRGRAVRNEDYTRCGERSRTTPSPSATSRSRPRMVAALKAKEIDVAYRGLHARSGRSTSRRRRRRTTDFELVESLGTEISYLVFNPKDPLARKPPVRKAVAQIDRPQGARAQGLQGHREPLYSMVPRGIAGHTTRLLRRLRRARARPRRKQDPQRRRASPSRCRSTSGTPPTATAPTPTGRVRGAQAPARRLRALRGHAQGPALEDVRRGLPKGEYPVFGRGWFPDFPDADNFIAPVRGQEERARHAVRDARDHRASCCPRRARRATAGPSAEHFERRPEDHRAGRAAAAAVAGQAVRGRERGDRPVSSGVIDPSTIMRCGSCTGRPAGRAGLRAAERRDCQWAPVGSACPDGAPDVSARRYVRRAH